MRTIEIASKAYLTEMRADLERAAGIAKVADAFAVSGNVERESRSRSMSRRSFTK